MNLADLRPAFRQCGDGSSIYEISFDCPVCGPPWRCMIKAKLDGPQLWPLFAWTAARFGASPLDWDTVTVLPSVRYEGNQAHGRKRICTAHFTITDGRIALA